MEHFFIEDRFYNDLGDYLDECDIDEENVNGLEETWSVEVEGSNLEKIFTLTDDYVADCVIEGTDRWEDRFPEDPEKTFEKIKKALKAGLDIKKINESLPSLYYPNGKKYTISKSDIIDWLK